MTEPDEHPHESEPDDLLRFRRLLVAIDGSRSSDLALSAAIVSAHRNRARVTLIGVAVDAGRWSAATAYDPDLQRRIDEDIADAMEAAVARIPADVPVTKILRHGKPGPEIVAEANAGNYDAVLLGARGVGQVGALIGSVSNHVLHHAEITVFVAHAPRDQDG